MESIFEGLTEETFTITVTISIWPLIPYWWLWAIIDIDLHGLLVIRTFSSWRMKPHGLVTVVSCEYAIPYEEKLAKVSCYHSTNMTNRICLTEIGRLCFHQARFFKLHKKQLKEMPGCMACSSSSFEDVPFYRNSRNGNSKLILCVLFLDHTMT